MAESIACPNCGTESETVSRRRTDVPDHLADLMAPEVIPPDACSNCGYEFRGEETKVENSRPDQASSLGKGELRVGSVMGRSFSILFRNIVPFGLLSLLVISPPYLYAAAVDPQIYLDETKASGIASLFGIVEFFLSSFLTAALVYGTFQELRSRHASIGDCISRGLALIFPVIGVAILAGLAAGLGSLLLVIPGLIVYTMLFVAIPSAVVERSGIFASLSRSGELTKGFRWQIFGILLIILISAIFFGFVVGLVGMLLLIPIVGPVANVLMNFVISATAYALVAVVSTVIYHDLRVIKEGVDVNEIAAVFD